MPTGREEQALPVKKLEQPLSGRCFLTAFALLGQFISHQSQELHSSSKVWSAAYPIWKEVMLKQDALLHKIFIKSSNLEENQ